jgi:hypothetical protein
MYLLKCLFDYRVTSHFAQLLIPSERLWQVLLAAQGPKEKSEDCTIFDGRIGTLC